jgi:hypothetical protein
VIHVGQDGEGLEGLALHLGEKLGGELRLLHFHGSDLLSSAKLADGYGMCRW